MDAVDAPFGMIGDPPPATFIAEVIGQNMDVGVAAITDSEFESRAGIESDVDVPSPDTYPPVANFADFTVLIAVIMLAMTVAMVVAIAAILPGNGTPAADAIPLASALPV